jgi:hypothetical protein
MKRMPRDLQHTIGQAQDPVALLDPQKDKGSIRHPIL